MIKINELRAALVEYVGHNNFTVVKYTFKDDRKKGYRVTVFEQPDLPNRMLPKYGPFEGLNVHLLLNEIRTKLLSGRKPLGFVSYELLP